MSWGKDDDAWNAGGDAAVPGTSGGGGAWRICNEEGHFARECLQKPEGDGLTGECFNCGEVGHNKANCTNAKVERAFTGICNLCNEQGHAARECPTNPITCKLCGETGHKAIECKGRRIVDWNGVPELDSMEAWCKLIDAAKVKDLDVFRLALKAYARSQLEIFDLVAVEQVLREDGLPIFLIGMQQEIEKNMTIVDITGMPDREFVLSLQFAPKPRRAKFATGWPSSPEENLERLKSCGYVQDCGVPLCGNCGNLGHVRKHCMQEKVEHETTTPIIQCVNCKTEGHRARDCTQERFNPHACKNCKQEGHKAVDCPEPRSSEGVECRKCNETGHFSRDCPNVEARTCRNCGSTDHPAKECDQPRNSDTVTCRNCEKVGHFSRDCPEPKDWSKVKCSNCGEMGHTIKRCKTPATVDDGANGNAVIDAGAGGWGGGGTEVAAGGEASWGNGGW